LLKKESRILGISGSRLGDRLVIVGVVFRGSFWLDGVVITSINTVESNYTPEISRMIRSTKQFPQLHAIIVSQHLAPSRQLLIDELTRSVRLPVIAIKPVKRLKPYRHATKSKSFDFSVDGKHVAVSVAGVSKDEARRLFAVGCAQGFGIPEAVKVADVLVKRLGFLERETRIRKRHQSQKQ